MRILADLFETGSGQSRKDAKKNATEMTKKIRLSNSARSIDKTIGYLTDNSIKIGYKVK